MKSVSRLAAALVVLAPLHALAGSVFLNGTKVDGLLTNTKIEKCGVEFDAKGNVQLTCPGYAVKVEGGAPAKPIEDLAAPATITKSYFLVTEQAVQGATEYDVEVYVNAKFVRKLKSDEEQIVTDITKHLTPGKNTVTFVARKLKAEAARRSFSPEHFFRVIIGEGSAAGNRVMIEDAVITYQRTAADTADDSREFTFATR